MTSPFTPAEIETLRKIINGELDREADYAAIIAANKTLDRLSPPEPEQPDEATKIWREMLVNAFEAVNDAPMVEAHRKGALPLSAWDEAQISRLRKVLAEKDAERDKWENSANYAHRQLGNATAELATLRAENERLKKLDVEYGQIETAIIFADPEFDGDSDHATCGERLIASVKRLAKAAERNPAEPEHRLSGEPAANAGEVVRSPSSRSSDGSGVEVQQVDSDSATDGWLCRIERLLSSDTFSTICFALLLITFDVSTWQAVLASLLYIKHATEPAAWLKAERAEHLKEGR